jgi:hypothetical protein
MDGNMGQIVRLSPTAAGRLVPTAVIDPGIMRAYVLPEYRLFARCSFRKDSI